MKNEIYTELLDEFGIKTPKIFKGVIASGDQFIADPSKIKEMSVQIENLQCVRWKETFKKKPDKRVN